MTGKILFQDSARETVYRKNLSRSDVQKTCLRNILFVPVPTEPVPEKSFLNRFRRNQARESPV